MYEILKIFISGFRLQHQNMQNFILGEGIMGIFKIQGCYVPQKSIFDLFGKNCQLVWRLLKFNVETKQADQNWSKIKIVKIYNSNSDIDQNCTWNQTRCIFYEIPNNRQKIENFSKLWKFRLDCQEIHSHFLKFSVENGTKIFGLTGLVISKVFVYKNVLVRWFIRLSIYVMKFGFP